MNPPILFDGFAFIQLFATGLALFLAAVNLKKPKSASSTFPFISGIFLLLGINIFHDWAVYSQYILQAPNLLGLGPIHFYIIGPLIYLYIVQLCRGNTTSNPKVLLHFVPAIFFQLDRLDIYFQSSAQKLAIIEYHLSSIDSADMNLHSLENLVLYLLPRLHWLMYLFLARQIIYKTQVNSRSKPMLQRIRTFINVYLFLQISVLSTQFVADYLNLDYVELRGVVQALTVYLIALLAMNYSEQLASQKISAVGQMTEEEHALWLKIKAALEQQHQYRDPKLSLNSLATSLSCSTQEISRLLNQFVGLGFNAYINQLRIKEACTKLDDLSYKDNSRTLEKLGYDVGFNSKSTFYRVFKAQVGVNPGDYLENKQAD
ncbi:helix-turn-helix domain-containing protein [Thalassotalea ganghwensis]